MIGMLGQAVEGVVSTDGSDVEVLKTFALGSE